MIGDSFLDECTHFCLMATNDKEYTPYFSYILKIIDAYKLEMPKEKISHEYEQKMEIAKIVARYRAMNTSFSKNSLIETCRNGKFGEKLIEWIDLTKDEKVDPYYLQEVMQMINNKKLLCEMFMGKRNIERVLIDLETGNFLDDSEIRNRWEQALSTSFEHMMELKRVGKLTDITQLNLGEDDYGPVLKRFTEKLDSKKILKSGFNCLNKCLTYGGFEPSRIYLFGGESGVGKSLMLVNLLADMIIHNNFTPTDEDDEKAPATFLYITAENLVDETFKRLYCAMTKTSAMEFNELMAQQKDVKQIVLNMLAQTNSNIIIRYVPANVTQVSEIEKILEEVKAHNNVKCMMVDYLDLLRGPGGVNAEDKLRLELGAVTQSLKNMAIMADIPIITVTQLNRSGYAAKQPSLVQLSESMLKANNSDVVLFLQREEFEHVTAIFPDRNIKGKCVRFTVLKNRDGRTDQSERMFLPETITHTGKRAGEVEDVFCFRFDENILNTTNSFIKHGEEKNKGKMNFQNPERLDATERDLGTFMDFAEDLEIVEDANPFPMQQKLTKNDLEPIVEDDILEM